MSPVYDTECLRGIVLELDDQGSNSSYGTHYVNLENSLISLALHFHLTEENVKFILQGHYVLTFYQKASDQKEGSPMKTLSMTTCLA